MNLFMIIFLCLTSSWALFTPKDITKERIVGGVNALAGEFPFAAAIYVTTNESKFFCGGTLLTNQWILTAGQCVYNAVLFSIYVGSNTLGGDDPNRLVLATNEFELYPDFNPETLKHDIALIRLRMPIELNDYRRQITYLPGYETEVGTTVIALGWGQTSDQDSGLATNLQKVDLISISNTECQLTYGDQLTSDKVCLTGNYNEGACIGDTGSPILERVRDAYRHVGVASFVSGNGCESTDPSGYTRSFNYLNWIRNITRRL